jgi:hypothetical protein
VRDSSSLARVGSGVPSGLLGGGTPAAGLAVLFLALSRLSLASRLKTTLRWVGRKTALFKRHPVHPVLFVNLQCLDGAA